MEFKPHNEKASEHKGVKRLLDVVHNNGSLVVEDVLVATSEGQIYRFDAVGLISREGDDRGVCSVMMQSAQELRVFRFNFSTGITLKEMGDNEPPLSHASDEDKNLVLSILNKIVEIRN